MKEEAYKFLVEHKGYLKKSISDIQDRLGRDNIQVSLEEIKELKLIIRLNGTPAFSKNIKVEIPSNMKVKSMWTMANGKTGYSYKADEAVEETNDIIESLQRIIEEGVTPFGVRASKSKNDRMISIFSSDKHIGAMTARNSIYSNDYDREEIFRRHELLVNEIIDEHNTFGQFSKLVFYDLGDALDGLDGQTTRGGHNLPQNMDSREQIDTFIEVTIKTMETLINADISEEIWFIATTNDNHCFSQNTEVLTNEGWKLYSELNKEHLVANKNLITGEILFEKPLDYILNENVNCTMHEYKNKNINLSVTDEHRMLYRYPKYDKTNKTFEYCKSKDLRNKEHAEIKFQVSGKNLKEDYNISDDFIKFTAWVLTDGTITKYKDESKGFVIYQAKEYTKTRIRKLLNSMGLSYRESIKKKSSDIVCGKQLVKSPLSMTEFALNKTQTGIENMEVLMNVINDKITIPSWLYKLSKRQFDVFLHEYILGDGNVKVSTSATIHGRKEMLDQLQTLCVLNETKANLLIDTRGNYLLSVVFDKTEATCKLQTQVKNVDYSGYTWCLTMPQSNLVVRRNGRVSIQGNSGAFGHGAVRAAQLYLQAKYPQIKTFVSAKMLDHITFGDHTYIFGHGKDDMNMKSGLPLVLNDKTEGFINDYIDRKKIRSKYIHVITADLHQSAETFAKRFRYKKNMSMYGSSGWIHTNFGSGEAGVDYEITCLHSPKIYKTRLTYGHDS
jgi:hypothetical protein